MSATLTAPRYFKPGFWQSALGLIGIGRQPRDAWHLTSGDAFFDAMDRALATETQWRKVYLWVVPKEKFSATTGAHCILGVINILDHGSAQFLAKPFSFSTFSFSTVIADQATRCLFTIAKARLPSIEDLADYNNAFTTTHADILSLLSEARALYRVTYENQTGTAA